MRVVSLSCLLLVGCGDAASATSANGSSGSSGPEGPGPGGTGSDTTAAHQTTGSGDPSGASEPTTTTSSATTEAMATTSGPEPSTDSTGVPQPGDGDGDGVPDEKDNCPDVSNSLQGDTDADGVGDFCDDDDDGDGTPDVDDLCPLHDIDTEDFDGDGKGDHCDDDDDDDGLKDSKDNCRLAANPEQTDTDNDGYGDACDDDDDKDGLPDDVDNCPLVDNPKQNDLDGDGIGNQCDEDADGDGVPKPLDPFDEFDDCPGKLLPNKVYAATWDTVYAVDVDTYALTKLATAAPGDVGYFDLAIDQHGFMYALAHKSFYGWFKCVSGTTGTAMVLKETDEYTPGSSEGFAGFPPGIIDPEGKKFGILSTDRVLHGEVEGIYFGTEFAGSLGNDGYFSSGDLTYVAGFGTYASVVHESNDQLAMIIEIDPVTGALIEVVATLAGYSKQFALATWGNRIIAFGIDGEILEINPQTKLVKFITDTNFKWYGAAGPL